MHFLVRMYPLEWRERYQFEFLGLFEESEPTWPDIADVARAAARERVRALIFRVTGPNESLLRTLVLRTLMQSALMIFVGVGIAGLAEIVSRASVGQFREGSWFSFIQLGLLLRMVLSNIPRSHLSIVPGDPGERVDRVTDWIGRNTRAVGRIEFYVWMTAIVISSVEHRLDRSWAQSFASSTIMPVLLCVWLGGLSPWRRKTLDEIDLIRSVSKRRHAKSVNLS